MPHKKTKQQNRRKLKLVNDSSQFSKQELHAKRDWDYGETTNSPQLT